MSMKYGFFFYFLIFSFGFAENLDEKIEKFILDNPEVILKSLENYEKKKESDLRSENKEKINKKKKLIFNSDNGLYMGNPNAEKIIVEFFDYNCSYCKKAHKDIKRLLKNYKNFKVVYKNFPILSEKSFELAVFSLVIAEKDQRKFETFHNMLMNVKGLLSDDKLRNILDELGFNYDELKKTVDDQSIRKKIKEDFDLAEYLGLKGTPAFILDDEIIFGYVGFEELSSKLID